VAEHGPCKLLTSSVVTHALGKNGTCSLSSPLALLDGSRPSRDGMVRMRLCSPPSLLSWLLWVRLCAAFNAVGALKLVAWLEDQEETHRVLLYVADAPNSPWMQRCVRQADLILVVAAAANDGVLGEYEQCLLGNVKSTARKELVLLHAGASVPPGTTHRWLHRRPWVHAHHHIRWQTSVHQARRTPSVAGPALARALEATRLGSLVRLPRSLAAQNKGTAPATGTSLHISDNDSDKSDQDVSGTGKGGSGSSAMARADRAYIRSDLARLARRLTGTSVGVVLGGGGARGLAHIGVLRALEEAGIPVDLIGGTSMGAFIGAYVLPPMSRHATQG
jgi:lysophospholipid hydrolase